VLDWVALWIPLETNFYNLPYSGQTIIRKSYKSPLFPDKILFQYFILINLTADPQSLPKKQNTFVAYTGYTFHEESQ
ncbi:1170_t:CDS:1, partial [Funneliformis geosporum]